MSLITSDQFVFIFAKLAFDDLFYKINGNIHIIACLLRTDNISFDSEEETTEDDEVRIVRTKKFGIKPMFPEDACVQMELLGHNFFVFSNAETDEVNVVYKRKDGSFGLIEPEFS